MLRVVTDEAGLRDLEPEWRALWLRSPARVPFQTPDWMLPWWACFGTGRPVVAVAENGLLACYLLGDKLLPIGAGLTDYQDALLVEDGSPDALVRAMLEAARALGAAEFHLTDLPPWSALRAASAPPGWRGELAETDPCPVLTLPEGGRDLREAIGASRARDVRQARHRAERAGGFEVADASPSSLERVCGGGFYSLERLHTDRWRSLGEPGVLDDPKVRAFHRVAVPLLHRAGALRILLLHIAGTPAAACYVLTGRGRLYLYLSGFDPAFAHQSPGTILLGHIVEDALRTGIREIHFLRGDESYKRAWGAVPRMNAMRAFVPA